MTNCRGDNTLINWDPSLEDKFVTKTRDQPEPGSFFPRSLRGGKMKDPGNEVARKPQTIVTQNVVVRKKVGMEYYVILIDLYCRA